MTCKRAFTGILWKQPAHALGVDSRRGLESFCGAQVCRCGVLYTDYALFISSKDQSVILERGCRNLHCIVEDPSDRAACLQELLVYWQLSCATALTCRPRVVSLSISSPCSQLRCKVLPSTTVSPRKSSPCYAVIITARPSPPPTTLQQHFSAALLI